ncbi:MAG: hypothetical protein H6581_17830 [Bacteroidia bacterium]|nr:hypothetical protein [Bacteroidia bacterium]
MPEFDRNEPLEPLPPKEEPGFFVNFFGHSSQKVKVWMEELALRFGFMLEFPRSSFFGSDDILCKCYGIFDGRKVVVRGIRGYPEEGRDGEYYIRVRTLCAARPKYFFEMYPPPIFSAGKNILDRFKINTNKRLVLENLFDQQMEADFDLAWDKSRSFNFLFKGDFLEFDLNGVVDSEYMMEKTDRVIRFLAKVAHRIEMGNLDQVNPRADDSEEEMFF